MKDKENYIGWTLEEFKETGLLHLVLQNNNDIFLWSVSDDWDGYWLFVKDGIITHANKSDSINPITGQVLIPDLDGKIDLRYETQFHTPPKDKWVWFRKKRVELGEGHIIAYTLFESKKHFGIIVYNWKTIKQNRFHSHAFPAYAFLLSGSYTEEVIENGVIVQKEVNNRLKRRYIPQNYVHRILKAEPRTWTIVFTGKWLPHWYEYFDSAKKWVKYSWGRKKVREYDGDETLNIIDK